MKKYILLILICITGALYALSIITRSADEDSEVPEGVERLVVVDKSNEKLNIYYPQYSSIDLICGIDSPEENPNVIFCCAAAFTATRMDEFQHSNINGNHVSGGQFHKGSAYSAGCFTWYDGKWKFSKKGEAEKALKTAAENGGMGFKQIVLILDGEKQSNSMTKSNIYRTLCELDGKLCIIESATQIAFPDFVDQIHKAGVTNAIYLDMGNWRHCWYRRYDGSSITHLHTIIHDKYTNWLTFYK